MGCQWDSQIRTNCFRFVEQRLAFFGHYPLLSLSWFIMYLVQCCLGNGVVFHAEPLFIGHHQLKYPSEGGGGDLVLQRVVVLLSLNTAGEGALHETLNGLQIRGQACLSCLDFHSHHIAVTKSASRKHSMKI